MLTQKDKRILKEIQDNFPLAVQPWKIIAGRLGMNEKDLIRRVKELKKKGVVRYVGMIFDPARSGLHSTLVAMKVPQDRIKRTAKIINEYPHVTHNYLRRQDVNMWFTLTASSDKEISRIISEIKQKTSVERILDLRTERRFKINARFKV